MKNSNIETPINKTFFKKEKPKVLKPLDKNNNSTKILEPLTITLFFKANQSIMDFNLIKINEIINLLKIPNLKYFSSKYIKMIKIFIPINKKKIILKRLEEYLKSDSSYFASFINDQNIENYKNKYNLTHPPQYYVFPLLHIMEIHTQIMTNSNSSFYNLEQFKATIPRDDTYKIVLTEYKKIQYRTNINASIAYVMGK